MAGVDGGTAELAVVDRDPVNSATIDGPETKAYASSVMITKSASPMRRAGPDTAGPSSTTMTGTMPEQSAMARAACPHPWRAAMPSRMSAPLGAIDATRGTLVLGRPSGLGEVADAVDDSARAARGVHPGDHHRTAVDVLDRGPHRARCPGP